MHNFDIYHYDETIEIIPIENEIDDIDYLTVANVIANTSTNTLIGRNINKSLILLPNIENIILKDCTSFEADLGDKIFDLSWHGTKKTISYIGPPISFEITIEGKINENILEINIPLNQNLEEILIENPNIQSLGCNGDCFNYWNCIPENIQRLVVFVTQGVNQNIASHYLRDFRGNVLFVTW
jgi:hypothetical protein